MSTPTMRVCQVGHNEDFAAVLVTDQKLSTLDVQFACEELADARVKIVTDSRRATEYIRVTS